MCSCDYINKLISNQIITIYVVQSEGMYVNDIYFKQVNTITLTNLITG